MSPFTATVRLSKVCLVNTATSLKCIKASSKAPDTMALCRNSEYGWSATNRLQFVFVRLWGQSSRPKAHLCRTRWKWVHEAALYLARTVRNEPERGTSRPAAP